MMIETEAATIAGVVIARSRVIGDARGEFARLFCAAELAAAHAERPIVQINLSRTGHVGALRGLHFQTPPFAESKWVRCLKGRVFDIAVDLRRGSPTFLQHCAVELSPGAMNAIFIPEGCAHGFQALEPESELLYLHSAPYAPDHEGGLRWDDPALGIAWPLAVTDVSERDRGHPLLDASFKGIAL
jgi:dTDP-4-dehydrorhamnose 3,5-epimerase